LAVAKAVGREIYSNCSGCQVHGSPGLFVDIFEFVGRYVFFIQGDIE